MQFSTILAFGRGEGIARLFDIFIHVSVSFLSAKLPLRRKGHDKVPSIEPRCPNAVELWHVSICREKTCKLYRARAQLV
jgi:hypothetical protein